MAARLTRGGWKTDAARAALTLGSVLAAGAGSVLLQPATHVAASPLFVAAVMVSAWLGGLAWGLLATVLATIALDGIMTASWPSLSLSTDALAQLAVFVFVALFVSALDHARRRSEIQRAILLERERAARAEAEDANRAKDEFVTMVAHELRTPLTAIVSWSAVLSDARIAPTLAGRALDAIRRNVGVQARVIGDLVDLSRLGRGRLSLQLEAVDLRSVIDAAVESVAATAAARGIKVAIDTAEAGRPVHGDAARLQQVVSNLLGNAIKHSGDGATVHVTVDAAGGAARIIVRDEGRGIAPELLPHIFEPYRQGADAANSGLGLGLAIVRQLVELHGGAVQASSAGLGRGACFTVLLPRYQAPPISPTTRTRTRSELPGR